MAGIISGESVLVDRYPYGSTPKVQPVDTEMLRQHLQLSQGQMNELMLGPAGKLAIATAEVEQHGNVSLVYQQREHYIDECMLADLEENTFRLGFGPVVSVTAIKYLDEDDAEQTLSTDLYRASRDDVYFKTGLPTLADGPGTLWIEYTAGYGTSHTAVPADWQSIVFQVATRRYEVREGADGTTDKTWDRMIEAMIVAAGGNRRY